MGTWSAKPFGNDTALDWLDDLSKQKNGALFLANTIEKVSKSYDGCSTKAEQALAAISIIAASTDQAVKGTNQEAKSWIIQTGYVPTREVIDDSLEALKEITSGSELYDLWGETESLKTWLKDTEKLKIRLLESKNSEIPKREPKKKGVPRSLYKLIEFYKLTPEEKIRDEIFKKVQAIKNVNEGSKDTDFYLPLSLMAKHGLYVETIYLLSNGANPNAEEMIGGSPFSRACISGHTDIAEALLEAGAEIFGETVMDKNTGYSYNPDLYQDKDETPGLSTYKYCVALFSVASTGKPEVIDYLITKGCDINQIDLNGETLIHKACFSRNNETLAHLISLGVDLNASKGIINSNKDSRGETALHYAVSKNNAEAVKLLLDNGADPNITEYFNGREHNWKNTPLDIVSEQKDSEIYKLLLEYGGKFAE
jgi:ankyrin repeat protein